MIIPSEQLSASVSVPIPKNVEFRGIPDLPAVIALTEKMAGICFRQLGGRKDYAGFFGDDAVFRNWVKDLFLHYWDKGQRI